MTCNNSSKSSSTGSRTDSSSSTGSTVLSYRKHVNACRLRYHTLTIFLEDLHGNFPPVLREVALHVRLHDRLQATNA